MNKMIRKFALLLALLIPFVGICKDEFPEKSNRLVNDYTGNTFTPPQLHALEQECRKFNDSTSTQIAIVIMKSVGDYDIADYAAQLGDKWGIGTKKKDNGILIVVAKDDHKMTIQVGYGLEPVIPDAIAKTIIENEMKPSFKEGNFYLGLHNSVITLMSLARKEFTPDQYMKNKQGRSEEQSPFGFLSLVILVIVFFVFFRKYRSVRNYAAMNNLGFWAAWALLAASTNRSSGYYNNFNYGGGGFGGFGGGGGGGSSDSGFGGFGGGSFGGGGASGSW
ncbi:MAG: TPM domain-containing protein [Bacteroidota bacterium]